MDQATLMDLPTMPNPKTITLEVIYALPSNQTRITLTLPQGSTARDALQASGLTTQHPDTCFETLKVGVFGKFISLDTQLQDQQRVEFYRPLLIDPMEMRRRRAKQSGFRQGLRKPR